MPPRRKSRGINHPHPPHPYPFDAGRTWHHTKRGLDTLSSAKHKQIMYNTLLCIIKLTYSLPSPRVFEDHLPPHTPPQSLPLEIGTGCYPGLRSVPRYLPHLSSHGSVLLCLAPTGSVPHLLCPLRFPRLETLKLRLFPSSATYRALSRKEAACKPSEERIGRRCNVTLIDYATKPSPSLLYLHAR